MITLKEALTLASDDIKKIKDDLKKKIKKKNIGAYVEQLVSTEYFKIWYGYSNSNKR